MDRQEVHDLVLECLPLFAGKSTAPLNSNSPLFAANGLLDSISLVSFLMEVEQRILERHRIPLLLVSDKALSQKSSPFVSVDALVGFILKLKDESQ
jgi:hypothetical protein